MACKYFPFFKESSADTIKRLLDHGAFGAVFEVADACTVCTFAFVSQRLPA